VGTGGRLGDVTYDERLRVPWSWWLVPVFFLWVLWLTTDRIAGHWWAWLVTLAAAAAVAGLLVAYGAVRVRVASDGLTAGNARLPLRAVGRVRPLGADAARALRGPRADARAHMLLRGYVPTAVQVEVVDPADPTPYWYVSTRHPAELAAALTAARKHA
jgi:Protein of unknown function (DUF3093)